MKKKVKKNPFITIGLVVLIAIILVILVRSLVPQNSTEEQSLPATKNAEVLSLRTPFDEGETLNFEASVKAENETAITAESSGKVTRVAVSEGDTVRKGDILFSLNGRDQEIAYQQALVQLDNQRLALQNLEDEFNGNDDSVQSAVQEQQELNIRNAYQAFLNNDLQAYPEDNPEEQDGGAPIISGTYQSTEEGVYVLEVYQSGTESGASVRYSGLETGVVAASTNLPVALGNRGLRIQFPVGFDTSETWIISIPNQNSSSFVQARSNYEAALQAKETTLTQSAVTQEQLDQQRNAVRQQELSVSQSLAQLEKTRVRAPFDGDIISLDVTEGSVVSAFSPVGTIKSLGELELEFSISSREAFYLNEGDIVYNQNLAIGEIEYIAQSLDANNFKNIVRVSLYETNNFTEGETITISVQPNSETELLEVTNIPLTAVKIIGNDPYVGVIQEDNTIFMVPVETGLLFGSQIEIISGLEKYDLIIRDIRGFADGERVQY